ncbi:MAG TPA: T3SS effector HopA1 family protein [Pyrinomonadaceae bacterium]|nr:T3SS effector HopA1 family protein [Pyrinomonadaceae bacterium]
MSHEHATPPEVRQALDRLFRSVCIHSVESFSYPHAFVPTPPPPPTAVGAEERRRLVRALRDTLYARCYARPPVDVRSGSAADDDAGDSRVSDEPVSAEEFARRLSAANRGRDGWLAGWRVESVGAGGVVVVARGASRRVARPGDYALAFAEDVPPCVGCAVTLRVRKESLTVQEGVYCALGEQSPRTHEESDVIRVYFNAPVSASLSLTEAATTHLNEWGVPFTLKVMLRRGERDRRDSAVLYLPRGRHRSLFQLLEKLPAQLFSQLRPGVPLFTKPLGVGVGLAESPLGGESFGMHRCRLLAESIVDAWLGEGQDAESRWRAAERRFAAEGLSLARAYLNPGNEDVYDPSPSASFARDTSNVGEAFRVLTRANVGDYLRARGLSVGEGEGVGAWRVTERHSRNQNFVVTREDDGAQGFFVKQLRAQDPESFAMLRREAHVYELARRDADFASLREVVPPFFGFDAAARATVLGALDGESLMQLQQRLGRFPSAFGRALGRALALVHSRVGRTASGDPPRGVFNLEPPGIFTAHRDGPLVRWLGPGQMRLVEQVREHALLARVLDGMAATWRHDSFIHGDIKFENCVVVDGAGAGDASDSEARAEIKLVDWELADFGEAAWDVGALTQAYLALCLSHAPAGAALREQLQTSAMSFDSMRRAVVAFWRAYREEAFPDETTRVKFIERAMLCAAARLIQSALEVMHGQPRPTPLALTFLSASIEVASGTRETARWLGFDD